VSSLKVCVGMSRTNSKDNFIFSRPDFFTIGLGRLQQAQDMLLDFSRKDTQTADQKEKIIKIVQLLASAYTDLLGDSMDRGSSSTTPWTTGPDSMSQEEQQAIRNALGFASVSTAPGMGKYLLQKRRENTGVDEKNKNGKRNFRSRSENTKLDIKKPSKYILRNRKTSHSLVEQLMELKTQNMALTINIITPKVMRHLTKVDCWNGFDVWEFNEAADGHCISLLCYHLMDRHSLFAKLRISRHIMVNFLKEIEQGYNDVPYHNKIHAADVLQGVNFFLQSPVLKSLCDKFPLMRLAAYIGAVVHDFKHPGTNNDWAKKKKTNLALIYNDVSVLENMHVSEAFRVLQKKNCDFLNCVSYLDYRTFRQLVVNMVLSTDMAKHAECVRTLSHTVKFKESTSRKWLDHEDPEAWLNEAEMLLDLAVHCGDLSSPCRPWKLMNHWTTRILQEFWAQGDLEKDHSLPVGPGNDRDKTRDVPLGQVFFVEGFVKPLWVQWAKVIPEAKVCLENLNKNLSYWQAEAKKLRKKEDAKIPNSREREGSVKFSAATRDTTLIKEAEQTRGVPEGKDVSSPENRRNRE